MLIRRQIDIEHCPFDVKLILEFVQKFKHENHDTFNIYYWMSKHVENSVNKSTVPTNGVRTCAPEPPMLIIS